MTATMTTIMNAQLDRNTGKICSGPPMQPTGRIHYALLCPTMSCYALLCSDMSSSAMLYHAMLCYTLLCPALFCAASSGSSLSGIPGWILARILQDLQCGSQGAFIMLGYTLLCPAMRCYPLSYAARLCYAMVCNAILCYAFSALRYAVLFYALLCFASTDDYDNDHNDANKAADAQVVARINAPFSWLISLLHMRIRPCSRASSSIIVITTIIIINIMKTIK